MSHHGWKGLTLQELANQTNSQLLGSPEIVVTNAAPLEAATPNDATFFIPSRSQPTLQQVHAGVTFIHPDTPRPAGPNYLLHTDPTTAFDQWVCLVAASREPQSGFQGIHPSAVIHTTAKLAAGVQVAPHAVIDQYAVIGPGTRIGPGAIIGPRTFIGADCHIHARVVLEANSRLGNRVIVHAGAVIGSCGYGLRQTPEGKHQRLHHIGNVELEDDVEIGANTTVDRARLASTIIGRGTKIDNLVQIAHNVKLGKHNLIVAQTGIAGSASTGDYVVLAGQVGVNGHIHITSRVVVAACSGVMSSIDKPGKYAGIPAFPAQEHHRQLVHLKNLKQYVQQVKQLQKEVVALKAR